MNCPLAFDDPRPPHSARVVEKSPVGVSVLVAMQFPDVDEDLVSLHIRIDSNLEVPSFCFSDRGPCR
jgi:hypothetical protein